MDNMQNMGGGSKNVCSCQHHKVVPVVIMLIGLLFLLSALDIVVTPWVVSVLWPIGLIIIGGVKMMSQKCKCC